MSIIDMLLTQKSILLTFGAAVLFLVGAVALSLIPRIRSRVVQYRRKRALRPKPEVRESASLSDTLQAVGAGPIPAELSQSEHWATAATPQVAQTVQGAPMTQTVQTASTAAPSQTQPSEAAKVEEKNTTSAMQDIVSSIFGNEEALAHYEMLLQGVGVISATDLLTMTIQVAEQLQKPGTPVPATKEQ